MREVLNPMIQSRAMDVHDGTYFRFIGTKRTAVIQVHGQHDELISVAVKGKERSRKQCMVSSTMITFHNEYLDA